MVYTTYLYLFMVIWGMGCGIVLPTMGKDPFSRSDLSATNTLVTVILLGGSTLSLRGQKGVQLGM
jgi:hypothetical protein